MLIRWKKWKQSNTGLKIADPRQNCFFSSENEGIVDVCYKQVVDRLLNFPHEFEPAWDRFGIRWDETGREIVVQTHTNGSPVAEQIPAVSYSEPVDQAVEVKPYTGRPEHIQRKRGRPRKNK